MAGYFKVRCFCFRCSDVGHKAVEAHTRFVFEEGMAWLVCSGKAELVTLAAGIVAGLRLQFDG